MVKQPGLKVNPILTSSDSHFIGKSWVDRDPPVVKLNVMSTRRKEGASRNPVRKWWRRHVPGQPSALAELSRRPKHCPHRTSSGLEGVIIKLRRQTAFGAERLHHEFVLPASPNAIARIIRQQGLTRPRKKKPATKKPSVRSNATRGSWANSPPTPSICRIFPTTGLR